MRLTLLLLAVSLSASAAKTPSDLTVENTTLLNPACPLTFTGIFADSPGKIDTRVSVHFVNQTTKRMIAVKLGLAGVDATRDYHPFPEEYAIPIDVKPDEEGEPTWKVSYENFGSDTESGVRVYLAKILFANGSLWTDDGNKSCSLTLAGRPGHLRAPRD